MRSGKYCVWLGVAGLPLPGYRTIAAHCGLDRKTVRRYVEAAQAAGLRRDDDVSAIDDGLIGMVAGAVRPARPDGHGAAWEQLLGFEEGEPHTRHDPLLTATHDHIWRGPSPHTV